VHADHSAACGSDVRHRVAVDVGDGEVSRRGADRVRGPRTRGAPGVLQPHRGAAADRHDVQVTVEVDVDRLVAVGARGGDLEPRPARGVVEPHERARGGRGDGVGPPVTIEVTACAVDELNRRLDNQEAEPDGRECAAVGEAEVGRERVVVVRVASGSVGGAGVECRPEVGRAGVERLRVGRHRVGPECIRRDGVSGRGVFGRDGVSGRGVFGRDGVSGRGVFWRDGVSGCRVFGRVGVSGCRVFGRVGVSGCRVFWRDGVRGRGVFWRDGVRGRGVFWRESIGGLGVVLFGVAPILQPRVGGGGVVYTRVVVASDILDGGIGPTRIDGNGICAGVSTRPAPIPARNQQHDGTPPSSTHARVVRHER
jgi:hypothetical protein